MGGTDWTGVRERVEALRARPGSERLFGADTHGFTLAPALSGDELADLETWLGVRLPDDYRRFLTEVGAGGAGPFCGVNPVRRADPGWQWHGECAELTDVTRLAQPFLVDRPFEDLLAALDEQEPQEQDFTDPAAYQEAAERWRDGMREIVAGPEFSAGAICLVHEGCNLRYWLVVSGPARGGIWYDGSCDWADMIPEENDDDQPVGFGEWYLDWLGEAERSLAR
ncbi:hypothetical protein Cme02nite_56010 [Catellatospora methionotrophica]|uniref:Knr4/Smi1-like domain-containing protein n=1 Tax=Catellatospora methionotrophica TaxID=121620 RepID=A0A8J3PI18_9ACTN|nr:SMI1/KNR4 family protein [Catellatospora methionotrophica]GIG17269.1 hypothetical protein Cme02nite_56010 [Catellatospora methionotrophica]